MKNVPRILPLLAPLCLAFVPAADEIRYDPKPGSETSKKLDITLELNVEEFAPEVNDQPLPPEAMGQIQDLTITLGLAVGVTEKLAGIKDGRATDFLRTYESVHGRAEAGDESTEDDLSDLAGKTVHFVWDESKGEYKKSWHESTGKDELLNTLSPDMDVSALLPSKKVSKGDKWEVGGSKVISVILPGMQTGAVDLDKAGLGAEESKAVQIMLDELGPQFEEGLKHLKVGCEYQGSHEADGANVADVKLHLDGEIKVDLGPMIERIASEERGGNALSSVKAGVALDIKGDGVLLWNTDTHVLQSYTLDAELKLHVKADASGDEGGQPMKFHCTVEVGGKASWKLAAQKGDKPTEAKAAAPKPAEKNEKK